MSQQEDVDRDDVNEDDDSSDDGDDDRLLMPSVGKVIASTRRGWLLLQRRLLLHYICRSSAIGILLSTKQQRQTSGSIESAVCVCVCVCVCVWGLLDSVWACAVYRPPALTQSTERKLRQETLVQTYAQCTTHSHTLTDVEACAHTCNWLFLHLLWIARWLHTHTQTCTLSRMQIIWDKAHTRSAYRDTRRLQRSTWLPKAPEAHVNSSLHPTLGLCILTKHLAVSAPVHHSRDPPPTSPLLPLSLSLRVGRLHSEKTLCVTYCDSWWCLWVSVVHAYSFGLNHQAEVEIAG